MPISSNGGELAMAAGREAKTVEIEIYGLNRYKPVNSLVILIR